LYINSFESFDSVMGAAMHGTVQDFVRRVLRPSHVEGKRVLEVGSYDVNGSVKPYVQTLGPSCYLGVDQNNGPGVDQIADCERLTDFVDTGAWDLVISTEMLEHVNDWRKCCEELVGAVAKCGFLLITTRSPGFPFHAFPVDNWRFTRAQMFDILTALNMAVLTLEDDPEPGVFALARKPLTWVSAPNALSDIEVDTVVPC
jgi:SAM-dependent methyltransferase